jgi:hypothetical protein
MGKEVYCSIVLAMSCGVMGPETAIVIVRTEEGG